MREVVGERVVVVDQRRLHGPSLLITRAEHAGQPAGIASCSALGDESATIPRASLQVATPSRRTIVRIAMHAVHRPVREEAADRAGVRTAPVALEVGDDLHRAHLGAPLTVPAGKQARSRSKFETLVRAAGHLGDEVRDVRVALRLEEPLDVDGARLRDAGEVVAAEVDKHHVLGSVLLGRQEPLGVSLTRMRRAGDRIQLGDPVVGLDQRLRRGSDECELVQLQQEEVRRRIDASE